MLSFIRSAASNYAFVCKHNDDDNLVSIATNVSITGVDQDAERVEFVAREERAKRKRNLVL